MPYLDLPVDSAYAFMLLWRGYLDRCFIEAEVEVMNADTPIYTQTNKQTNTCAAGNRRRGCLER
jgi:hypothetical protein